MSHEYSPEDFRLLSALSARYSLADLMAAHRNGVSVRCYWKPDCAGGRKKLWTGIPSQEQIQALRLMLGAALGRQPAEYVRTNDGQRHDAPDPRSPVGTVYEGFERIQTYKWTTSKDTRKPIPPNSFVWRDTITGAIYVRNPFERTEPKQETA